MATCPARHDLAVNASQSRTKLPPQVGCNTLRDRVKCASAVDGRTMAIHLNQPCVPAQVQFLDGTLCHTARYVADLSNDAAASTGGPPLCRSQAAPSQPCEHAHARAPTQ